MEEVSGKKREKGKKPKQQVKQGGEKDGAVKNILGS